MSVTPQKPGALFGFRCWPYWLLIGCMWLLVQLPYRWFMRLGQVAGYAASFVPHYNRTITAINIHRCFPEKTDAEKAQWLRSSYASLGMAIMETVFACFAPERRLKNLLHLDAASAAMLEQLCENTGVLIIVPHYHVLDIVGRLYALRTQHLSAVYRPHRKPVIESINRRYRGKIFEHLVPRTHGKTMIRILRHKGKLLFLPDIDAGKKHSVFAPFFGIPAASVTSVAKLASLGKAKVVIAHAYRHADLSGYTLSFTAPLKNYPSADILQDITCVNAAMEALIRLHPAQYLWQYRRFRTQPPGEKDFYPKKPKFLKG